MQFLDIKNVSKVFHPSSKVLVHALKKITLHIDSGEFVVLSGPSGSGKTTLLNLIGGLDSISEGEITLEGMPLSQQSEDALADLRREHIGFIFQAYNLIPVLSAKENIEYLMRLQNWDKKRRDERTHEVAQKLGIAEILEKLPGELSGGQQQRVAVARAVASKPKLILADEPTANLDSDNAKTLMEMLEKLNLEEGITIIFSSHDPNVINKARRLITLHDGAIVKNQLMDKDASN